MNTLPFARVRRALTLVVAAVLVITAAYAPVLLDEVAGTSLTTTAFACPHSGGGC